MRVMSRAWVALLFSAASAVLLTNCTKLNGAGGGVVPSPSASPTPTASPTGSPAPCATLNPNSNVVVVGMAGAFAPVTVPTYGAIGEYAVIDQTGTSPPPSTAQVITTTVAGSPITPANVLQFENAEAGGSSVLHSAVGFLGGVFPQTPYAFPTAEASPVAGAITNTKAWSTGLVTAPVSNLCYSQSFTLTPGTYYFGDYSYYNFGASYRDVLVVSPQAAAPRKGSLHWHGRPPLVVRKETE